MNILEQIRPINAMANLDKRYGTYATVGAALVGTTGVREKGLTVGVLFSGEVMEFWFKSGINDEDLVLKLTGGGAEIDDAITSLSYTWSSTKIAAQIAAVTYTPPTYTTGSILFADVNGLPTQNNSQVFWDNTNFRIGFGQNSALTAKVNITGKTISAADIEGVLHMKQTWGGASTSAKPTAILLDITAGGDTTNASFFKIIKNGTTLFDIINSSSLATTTHTVAVQNLLCFNASNFISAGNTGGFRFINGTWGIAQAVATIDGVSRASNVYNLAGAYYGGHLFTATLPSLTTSQIMGVFGTWLNDGSINAGANKSTGYHGIRIEQNITQTNGADGRTYGIRVNPTLTTAYDYRAFASEEGKIVFGGTGVHSYTVLHRVTTAQATAYTNQLDGMIFYNTDFGRFRGRMGGVYRDLNSLKGYTVATLPASPNEGDVAYVTDGLTPTYLTAIVGGGAIKTPVFYNGTTWVAY